MDWLDLLASGVVIAAAMYLSDWFFRAPKPDYVDRESPEILSIERRIALRQPTKV